MPNGKHGIEHATWHNQRRSPPAHAALPTDAAAPSDGATPSTNCWRYRQHMPIGSRLCPTVCVAARSPRCSKPWSSSTSLIWWRSNCPAATAAINNANERKDASQLCREEFASGGVTIRTRLLDRSCGVMTSPKPAHETIPNWPPSNWNGGRDQIGIGGRLRRNPQGLRFAP